jgi:thiaminase/transcriptional activator TenA
MTVPRLTDRLRASCVDEWEALHAHPFVCGLADGSLPLDAFRFYVEQNLQYLPEYARAMALAASRADDVETMQIFSGELVNVLESEIPENRVLLERAVGLGAVDAGGAAGMAPATVAYTSFLVASAARGGPVEVMAAIVPCTWSYGDIGRRLRDEVRDHPVYAEWVSFFGSDGYASVVETMRRDFEHLAGNVDDEREARLAELFVTGVRLEGAFWDMAAARAHWPDAVASRYSAP